MKLARFELAPIEAPTHALLYDVEGRYVADVHGLEADTSTDDLSKRAALYANAPGMRALLLLAASRLGNAHGALVDQALAKAIGLMLAKVA